MPESAPRAFRREGLFARALPFGVATWAGLAILLTFGPHEHGHLLLTSASFVLVLGALGFVVPWHRLPRWTDLIVPLIFLGLVAALRRRVGDGLPALTVAPYFLVPSFWVALHGSRRDVFVMLAAMVAVRFAPNLRHGFERGEVGYAASGLLMASVISIATHQIVERSRRAERSLREILDGLPIGFAVNRGGRIVYANAHLAGMLGRDAVAGMIGEHALDQVHPEDREAVVARARRALADEPQGVADVRFLHANGGLVVLQTQPVAIRFEGERAVGVTLRDVTDERHLTAAETELRETLERERTRMEAILARIDDGVAVLDTERRGIMANRAYLALFDLTEAEFAGITRQEFMRRVAGLAKDPELFVARLGSLSDATVEAEAVFEFERPRRRVMRRRIASIALPEGPGYLVVWHDITADRDLVAERERQATIDPLTGIANRRGADEALAREVARARRTGAALSVAVLDLDHFKAVNDAHGHEVGDRVLAAVARVLVAHARITDTVARWGGEEFLAILPGPIEGARSFCERIRTALAAEALPPVGRVTISAGVAALAADELVGVAVERADAQLYEAKRAGRDCVR